jgi:hypothetical protein
MCIGADGAVQLLVGTEVLGAVQQEMRDGLIRLSTARADRRVCPAYSVEVFCQRDVARAELEEEDGVASGEDVGEVRV